MSKILIAIPCMDSVPYHFAESLLNLYKTPDTRVCFKANSLVYDSRNLLSLTAIEHHFDRVLWLDSDMVVPYNALRQLSEDMDEHGYDMVTGVYYKRTQHSEPVLASTLEPPTVEDDIPIRNIDTYDPYPTDTIFPIAACGFGCVMTSVDLLKQVWDTYQNAFLPFPWAGEDYSFCYRVKLLGKQIYCDPHVQCGHVGTMIYSKETQRG